jgi:hypothetical protein
MVDRARLSVAVAGILAVLLGASVVWGLSLQAKLDRVGALPGATAPPGGSDATPSPMASGSPSSGAAVPSGSVAASGSPTPSGAAEVDGAVWYPPQAGEASIVVAADSSTSEARARADVLVSGAADDEINDALDRLGDAGGGQLLLLGGRYELDAPVVLDAGGLALVGETTGNGVGYSASAIGSQVVPSDAFPDGEFLVRATPDAYGPMVSLLHLDGLERAQGLLVEGPRPTVSLNVVTQAGGAGMRFAGESTGVRPYDGFVLFNRVFDGLGIGILHDERSGDMLIEGNVVFRNEGDGFQCFGASQMYRVNHVYNNGGVGLRLIPGCVRTRLSSNKWEGNASGGVSIEGGSGFTIVGDTFAHNEADQADAPAHIEIGVRGETETTGVMLWGLSFGKGSDDNSHLIHVGSLGHEVHLGPVHSAGAFTQEAFRVDPGGELLFYEPVADPTAQ